MATYSPRFYVLPRVPALPQPEALPRLVTLGNPRLAQPSAPVDPARIPEQAFQQQLATPHWVMMQQRSMGIAAPQVGWFDRHFVMILPKEQRQGGNGDEAEVVHWINPEIVSHSEEQAWCWEGCLSVPGFRGWVRRPWAIGVRVLDAQGSLQEKEYGGWEARSFLHEFDHLEGLLFPYRVANPRHVVRDEELEQRGTWPKNWPAPGAARQPFGVPLREGGR